MEKRILKWTTGCFGLLTIVMCTTLCLLPGLKDDVTAAVPTMPNSNTNISQETPIEIDQEELVQENKYPSIIIKVYLFKFDFGLVHIVPPSIICGYTIVKTGLG